MKIEIAERRPVTVAYLRYTGPFGEPLGRFWRNVVTPWIAEHDLTDCPRYGVILDDPMETPADRCRYHACVEPPPGLSLPGADETQIAGGRYAVTHFRGSGAQIGAAWGRFLESVISDEAYRHDVSRPQFEHYPRGAFHDPQIGVFACELCLPLLGAD
jgi:AraC family transcriptional regulator